MPNLHDDNYMDELSRRAAEQFEPDHEVHSWEKLLPQLDVELPQKKERKRRFIFFLFLFLLIGGGVVFSTVWNERQAELTQQEEKNVVVPGSKEEKISESKTTTNNNTSVSKPVVEQERSVTEPGTHQPVTKVPESKTIQEKYTAQRNKSVSKTTQPITKRESSKAKFLDKNTDQSINNTDQPIAKTDDAETKTEQEETKTAAPLTNTKTDQPTEKTEQFTPTPNPNKKKENSKTNSRWEFGAVFAPDVSTVKFTHTRPPGTNIGLTINYNLSKRWSLQTGVLYTSKNYKSYGKDYHPPKGYWTDYVKLETVTAECDMWDIPLNIRYNIAPRKSSNFFASAGLSSYLMRKEDYDFFYYYNGNPVNRFRSYYTDDKHWMSVLNLSVGYERQVSKHISLQAEPFFKQPLKGLGFGSVKLNTTGIFLSVKYKPLINKQTAKR